MGQPANRATGFAGLFTTKDLLTTTLVSLIYLALSALLVGFKTEQLILVLVFNVLFYSSFSSRKFIIGFSVFIVFYILFDYMKAFPNYLYNTVHIESLYAAEKKLFGISINNQVLTPNEFWRQNTSVFLDVVSGIFYLCWVPVPLIFAAFLFFTRRRQQFMYFALTFLFVNIIGFAGYYIYPAAPPWYVQLYGFHFIAHTPGNTAGLHRFDDYFQVHIFNALYAKSSNVFAAMPSLHSAYPLITLYYGIKNRLGLINILFTLIAVGIWFSAVYSSHHYVLDVLAGIGCATAGIFIFSRFIIPNRTFQALFIKRFVGN